MGFIDKITERTVRIENNHTFKSIKTAFVSLLPVFLTGAVTLAIQNFPINAVREFINSVFNGFFYHFFNTVYTATYGFASLYLVITLSCCLSQTKTAYKDVKLFCIITAAISYFASLGKVILQSDKDIVSYMNMSNIFPAMITTIISTNLSFFFYKLFNRDKPEHSTTFSRSLRSIFPIAACVSIFAVTSTLIGFLYDGGENINDIILNLLAKPFESIGATYFGGLLIVLVESVLWLFGIHGDSVFDGLLYSTNSAFAFSNGQITTGAFIDTFALLGGCGATICLLIAIIIFSKIKKRKKLCHLAGIPLIFNINEFIVFGLPIVLNPIYLVPFVLTPLVCYSIAYLATFTGIVPQIVNPGVQWTTPIIISGYRATGSVMGSVLQIFLLAIGVAIYAPFVLLDNRISKENEKGYLDKLTDICRSCEARGVPYSIADQTYPLRSFEDDVTSALFDAIRERNVHLKYQPQVKNGKVVAAEALLRFSYNETGYLYPPLVIAIALKNNLFKELSQEIVRRAITDLKGLQQTQPDFKIAVNLNLDLLMDNEFRNWLIESVRNSDLTPGTFGVEITEDSNFSETDDYEGVFNELKAEHIRLFMDDFSMGHTSISILQKSYFDFIKIDGKLIKQIENERIQSIVSSIAKLGKDLNFKVIAEYVETQKQRDILLSLGCDIFQGYLYYKDVEINDLDDILQKEKTQTQTETNVKNAG